MFMNMRGTSGRSFIVRIDVRLTVSARLTFLRAAMRYVSLVPVAKEVSIRRPDKPSRKVPVRPFGL
jgi:hypothetical protein